MQVNSLYHILWWSLLNACFTIKKNCWNLLLQMKRCTNPVKTAFHSNWALGNNKGGRKPPLSEWPVIEWAQRLLSWVMSELQLRTHIRGRSSNNLQRSPCSSRRSEAQQTEECQLGNTKKKYITKESPIRSAYDRSVSVLRQKKNHPHCFKFYSLGLL